MAFGFAAPLFLKRLRRAAPALAALALSALTTSTSACGPLGTIAARNFGVMFRPETPVPHKIRNPARADASLAVLWVGHATALVQIEDRFVLTDPVFTSYVGMVSRRLVEPGLDANDLPPLDAVLVSHMHFDHLSLGSLERIEDKVARAVVPEGGARYLPGFRFPIEELKPWQSLERRGLRITAVPVSHVGFRYGADYAWMHAFSGYVVEYRGRSFYFGGDTAYDPRVFRATGARFSRLDLALLPIAPVEPRDFMRRTHLDPAEALRAFGELGARTLVPIHFDTFVNSLDAPGDAVRALDQSRAKLGIGEERVAVLAIGEQRVLIPKPTAP